MPVFPISLQPELQAWHEAGLQSVLLDMTVEDCKQQVLSTAGQPEKMYGLEPGPSTMPRQDSGPTPQRMLKENNNANSVSKLPTADRVAISDSAAPGTTAFKAVQADSSEREMPTTEQASQLLPADFKEPWKGIFQKLNPAPVIWTYKELGEDLLIKGNPQRSAILKNLIGSLQLKKGSSAFWPSHVPALPETGTKYLSDAQTYTAGLHCLGSKIVIIFGNSILHDLGYSLSDMAAFSETIINGRMFILLPDFSVIMEDKSIENSVGQFLLSVFRRIHI